MAVVAAPAGPAIWVLLASALDLRLIRHCGPRDACAGPAVHAPALRCAAGCIAFGGRHAPPAVKHSTILAQTAATVLLVPAWSVIARVAVATTRARRAIARRFSFAFCTPVAAAAAAADLAWWRWRRCNGARFAKVSSAFGGATKTCTLRGLNADAAEEMLAVFARGACGWIAWTSSWGCTGVAVTEGSTSAHRTI